MSAMLIGVLLLGGTEVFAMRCGGEVVSSGDNKLQVASACGEPHYRERVSATDAEPEEAWIYDWPERNMQKLLYFRGVTLARIEEVVAPQGSPGRGTLRCSSRVVQAGASKLTVEKYCGEPVLVEPLSGDESAPREVWLYERGNATVELHFSGIRLERVEWQN